MDIHRELLDSLGITLVDVDPRALSPAWLDTIDPQDRGLVIDAWERAAKSCQMQRVEIRARANGVCARWLELTVQALGGSGSTCRFAAAIVDVTSEHELREREARYRAMVANSADAIALLDRTGRICFVTGAVERIAGYSATELTGRDAFEQIHPDDVAGVRQAFAGALAQPGLPISVEYRARHKDGSWHHREVIGVNRLDDPAIQSIVVNYHDTTARRHAQAALAERERVYQSIFEEALIGIAHSSLDGRFMMVNRRLCTLLGYTPQELTATDFMAISHPDEVAQDLEARTQLLAGAIRSYSREKRYQKKDGTYVWTSLTVSLHREVGGQPAYFIAVIADLTQRKQLERQGRQTHKMEAVGRLASGVAHDFNNLLTAMVGFADLALNQLETGHPARPDVEEIGVAGKSAASLTRQLLAFSRQQVLEPHVLDLNGVVSRMRGLLTRLIGEHIDLRWRLSTPLDPIYADAGQLEQVVVNLALNARDAMSEGGTLTIETANAAFDGAHVMLAISDTGVGLDDGVKEHLFEPFYTTKEVGKGTGLGLATVYGIVKQSGGAIRVYSEPGHGTTFKIFLPRAERAEEVLKRPHPAPGSLHGTETILVVEDQREVRLVAAETLRRHGYDVIEAGSGSEALEVAGVGARGQIDLLLTDAVMPGMSGRALAERFLRERPAGRVLYMSGYTNSGVAHWAFVDPSAAFIQKPFAPNALLQKVREVLDEVAPQPQRRAG
jgi:PAS domain S-box-containing protein